jgi:hypothetical protein
VWGRTPVTAGTIVTAPAVKEGIRKVWVGTTEGDVITFDAADLSIVRTVSFGNTISRTVCLGPNLIVTTMDGHLFAIDTQTEQIRWSQQLGVAVPFVETTDVLLTNTTGGTTAQQRGGTKRRIPMQLLPNFREMFFTFQICSRQIFRFRFAGLIHQ